jgi:biopolymer transport protein ExbB
VQENMKRNDLIRLFMLPAVLAVVALVIIAAKNINSAAIAAGQRQSFFEQFFIAGGPVVWFVLFPMSLLTVYLVVEHALTINRKSLLGGGQLKNKIEKSDTQRLQQALTKRSDLVSVALRDALDKGKGDWFRMRSAMQESLQDQAGKLLRKIEWLSLIGGVSPMVGLFGTVFGMIKLFNAIVSAGGQPQPAQLADGIGVALVTTFWGLFIAIPALAVYGVFRNRIETLVSEAVTQSEELIPLLRDTLKEKTSGQTETVKFRKVPIVPLQEKSPAKTAVKNRAER